ncbi:hypothetical protein SS50377_21215 [Spironucleus salmonicida]|uniref:Uncharacterized protein n=1 Tax=Spironucleus salmonicida TaxID=348837 RepID=A0A9P8M0N9_9EUKA|nr:hypothetical protein SS50377_21215 [Spironucleus salmonicida]
MTAVMKALIVINHLQAANIANVRINYRLKHTINMTHQQLSGEDKQKYLQVIYNLSQEQIRQLLEWWHTVIGKNNKSE